MSVCDDTLKEEQSKLIEDDVDEGRIEDDEDDECDNRSQDVLNGDNEQKMDFDVLDDLNDDDDDDDDGNGSSDDGWDDSEEDVPIEEIDAMLDQKLDEYRARKSFRSDGDDGDDDEMAHEEREKVVLKGNFRDNIPFCCMSLV